MPTPPAVDDPSALVGLSLVGAGAPARGYRLEGFLGAGTQALVFAGRTEAGGAVAVKVLRPSLVRAQRALAEVLAQKEWVGLCRVPASPHVVRAFDVGRLEHGGLSLPGLVLERLHAVTLAALVARVRSETGTGLAPDRALLLLGQAAEGVRVLHAAGVVHRDLKPSNVLVTGEPPAEVARIADLGVSHSPGLAPTFGVGARLGLELAHGHRRRARRARIRWCRPGNAGRSDADAHVRLEHATPSPREGGSWLRESIERHRALLGRSPRHCEDLAVGELVSHRRRALEREALVFREPSALRAHRVRFAPRARCVPRFELDRPHTAPMANDATARITQDPSVMAAAPACADYG